MTDNGNDNGDAQIAKMSPEQRRDLILRLERPLDEVFPATLARRMRRNRLTLMVGGSIALIPWTIYLAITLPDNYVAHNWPATWIGFDVVLVSSMIATAVLGWLRRELVILPAFTTGVLLVLRRLVRHHDCRAAPTVVLGVDSGPHQRAAGDHDHRRGANRAVDRDAAVVARRLDAGVAPAAPALTSAQSIPLFPEGVHG